MEDLLAVTGVTPPMVEKLRDFVIVLPGGIPVNVNTAPAEVLAALAENCSVSQGATIVQFRRRTPFNSEAEFKNYLGQTGASLPAGVKVDVKSDHFLVLSHVRLDRAALDAQSLVYRTSKAISLLWMREI